MEKIKKLFGGINLTWKKLILFAILAGVYTAIMALVEPLENTSFHDITVTFEVWILFGMIIITNSTSAKDSALKCFVFFLISQPLVYLIQVPFSKIGFGLFNYYEYWFKWTLLTIPMGFIGYYIKKEKWWSIIILTILILFLGVGSYELYLKETIFNFPYHLLTTIFCLITMILYPLCIFNNKKIKIASLIISILIIIGLTTYAFTHKKIYDATLLANGSKNINLTEKSKAYLEKNIGKVCIKYEEGLEDYILNGEFTKVGKTKLIIIDENNKKTEFNLTIKSDSFNLKKIKS